MTAADQPRTVDFRQLALEKMSSVLGEGRARTLLKQICQEIAVPLASAEELSRFAAELSKLGGFEGSVGALLSVRAVMFGARSR